MNSVDLIRRLYQHQRWANHQLLAPCRTLSDAQLRQMFPIGQGNVLATITHLYAAEFVWLAAIEGDPNPLSPFDIRFDSIAELENAWIAVEQRWDRFLSELKETDLPRLIAKRSTSSGAGMTWETPLADILLHAATHAQYTAAQLTNMLRHLGVTPLPDVMLITMSRRGG